MLSKSLSRLFYLCQLIPERLSSLSEEAFSEKPSPHSWSKKEILGHLIDSAANNHHRFVRAQFEDRPRISYDADLWVSCSHYQSMAKEHIISFWVSYNRHLAELILHLPEESLTYECHTGDDVPHTIGWLFDDYVVHMEDHLKEIVEYE